VTALALPREFTFSSTTRVVEESRGAGDPLMRRALVASFSGHLVLALGFLVVPWLFRAEPMAAPLSIDVELVELSAHETILPKQQNAQLPDIKVDSIKPPRPHESRPDPEKIEKIRPSQVLVPKPAKRETRSPEESSRSVVSAQAPASDSRVATVGVVGGELVQKARVSYQDMVATRLARAKRYPDRAVRNRVTGNGVLRLQIAAEGSVVSVEVVSSTQSPILDDELHRMVERAGPFPAFPPDMGMNKIALLVPVSFRLDS